MKDRKNNIIDAIYDAIKNKQSMRIKYNGGTHPGTIREIKPLGITKDKVKAMCMATEHLKFFNLEKIELPTEGENSVKWDKAEKTEQENTTFHSIQELLDRKRAELESLGYIIIHGDKSIDLHRLEKNKTSKYPYASISFSEFETLPNYFTEEVTYEKILRKKPWDVTCILKSKQSYEVFEKAAKAFYERSLQLAKRITQEEQD